MLSESELRQKKESQENIMILFRKLREGLSSIKRRDKFAIEGYETSLHLSVIFDAPVQTTSILSHLIPDMYQITKSAGPSNSDLNRLASVLICLLHHLVMAYPSQQTFRDQLDTISPLLLDCSSPAYVWITSLARSLRLLDYVKFDEMSRPSSFDEFVFPSHNSLPTIQTQQTPERPSKSPTYDLPRAAVYSLVKRLRMKMREKTWLILRSAYREMSTADEMREWFSRTLLLTSVYPETRTTSMEEWMAARAKAGDVRPKEGMEGRWIINKVR
ncbi:hypothetical protein BJ138DRAFT_1014702 [Hygrophoropsis aurantiaca]|uniref:Uncharacterized protein n=1 Tax=Hygrophoropsis aurantiaca TaxID=72124 RepID=A0ACB8A2G5_9AGAM|nr:hypothetical protein BJ138DRAFT_1014702 [Hygrophoropsis aurantiaca]